jgi:hypothetical protein
MGPVFRTRRVKGGGLLGFRSGSPANSPTVPAKESLRRVLDLSPAISYNPAKKEFS